MKVIIKENHTDALDMRDFSKLPNGSVFIFYSEQSHVPPEAYMKVQKPSGCTAVVNVVNLKDGSLGSINHTNVMYIKKIVEDATLIIE